MNQAASQGCGTLLKTSGLLVCHFLFIFAPAIAARPSVVAIQDYSAVQSIGNQVSLKCKGGAVAVIQPTHRHVNSPLNAVPRVIGFFGKLSQPGLLKYRGRQVRQRSSSALSKRLFIDEPSLQSASLSLPGNVLIAATKRRQAGASLGGCGE